MANPLKTILKGFANYLENRSEPLVRFTHPASGSIGTSVGGSDIQYFKMGDGTQKVLIVGGIHGNEVGTVKLAHRLAAWISSQARDLDLTLYIVPCLNPDGYVEARRQPDYFNYGRTGRFNANGVDLNRNFPTKSFNSTSEWTRGKDYKERKEVFAGSAPGSEPETQGLTAFIQANQITAYFALHSVGPDVMGNENDLAQELARIFGMATGYPVMTIEAWKKLRQTGTPKEWCDENDIAYVEIEASRRWKSDFERQKSGFSACFEFLSH